MNYPKQCIKCNKSYIADRFNSRFCSIACKVSFFNNLKRKEPSKEVLCGICDKPFMTWKKGHKFCSKECLHQHYIIVWRKRSNDIRKTDRSILKANESRKILLSSLQKEIIYGAILGDGCLKPVPSNNLHSIALGHCEKQLPYLEMKVDLLQILFQAKIKLSKQYNNIYGQGNYYRISSISHPDLTNIYHFFYRGIKRHITYKTLDLLTPTSLLIWHLDDGCNIKRFQTYYLATNRYTLSEVRMLSKWFWHKHRIKTTVQLRKKKTVDNQQKIYCCLYFVKEYAPKYMSLLKESPVFDLIPECMRYKFNAN